MHCFVLLKLFLIKKKDIIYFCCWLNIFLSHYFMLNISYFISVHYLGGIQFWTKRLGSRKDASVKQSYSLFVIYINIYRERERYVRCGLFEEKKLSWDLQHCLGRNTHPYINSIFYFRSITPSSWFTNGKKRNWTTSQWMFWNN